jgi:hypothetical protein
MTMNLSTRNHEQLRRDHGDRAHHDESSDAGMRLAKNPSRRPRSAVEFRILLARARFGSKTRWG